jgi:phage-related protein (TIGR01555 family)
MADTKPRIRVPATSKPTFTVDSFQNLNQRLGLGAGGQSDGSGYAFTYISRNRMLLEAAYRTSWIVGAAVDYIAEDMTKAGIIYEGGLEPDDVEMMQAAWRDLMIAQELTNVERWARLYGGGIGYLMIDGQQPDTPLNLESIGEGQFKGILPFDRWVAQAQTGDLVTDLGPDIGLPKFYHVFADQSQSTPQMKIHYSRVIRRVGLPLPYYQRAQELLWGESVVERFWDRLLAFDSATTGAAQLVFKAYLRTLTVDGYRDLVASGGKLFEGFARAIENIRYFQNTEGLTVIDGKDKFETHTYTFAGLDDVVQEMGNQICGALEICRTRLFGTSPGGMNATGESDIRGYYDGINKKQENGHRRPVQLILDVLSRSVLGKELPEGFSFRFAPLWQMSSSDKATIAKTTTDAVNVAYTGGMITARVAAQELKASSSITGIFSNISEQDIDAMEDEIPDPIETAAAMTEATTPPGEDPANDPSQPGGTKPKKAAAA